MKSNYCFYLWNSLIKLSNEYGIEFHKEWRIYPEFKYWFKQSYTEGFIMDYKMVVELGKVSPYTCFFVPQKIPSLFREKPAKRDLPTGVYHNTLGSKENPYRVMSYFEGKRVHLGVFKDLEDAEYAYKLSRLDYNLTVIDSFIGEVGDSVLDLYRKKSLSLCE